MDTISSQGAIYRSFDYDDPYGALDIEDVEIGELPSDKVLVKMMLAPIQPCDLWCIRGTIKGVELPAFGGCEGVGVVEAVGADLADVYTVGERVHVTATHILGSWEKWEGTWRQHMMCPQEALIKVPDEIPGELACQLEVNPVTSMAMVRTLGLGPGSTVLLTAAASTMGRILFQLGKAVGFDVLGIVRRQESADELLADWGAEHVYVYDGTDESAEAVRTAIGSDFEGKKITHCIEAVGGATTHLCLDVLGPDGQLWIYGYLSDEHVLTVDTLAHCIMNNNSIHGWSTQENWMRLSSEQDKQDTVDQIVGYIADGSVKLPATGREFPLAEVEAALRASTEPGNSGKVLLRLSD